MTLPAWAGPYIGIPYADKGRDHSGVDCWGLVKLILEEVFGVRLPGFGAAYGTAADKLAGVLVIQAGALDGWEATTSPQPGDLVVFRVAGRPWHCGVMASRTHFLHAPNRDRFGGVLIVSAERIDSPMWKPRVIAFYRHPSARIENLR